ncbi:hypothetical protein FEE95_09030 [Maribacter algarum]|uniref:Outer membrane protein beta-barrel domain-containing protein n=1 Tax=Maribacter algarum (ex Zhang et al. 2020) TaxID=2578118 RepID=A0A5S3PPG4_9FLAO|nr:hypothetical protein [Maribacter algarum]TMM56637.1 hypothetical protein FEE95_09030 [Maribacter algarum]
MKNHILLVIFLINSSLVAQTSKRDKPKIVTFGFGMSIGMESMDKTIAEDVGISAIGGTWIDFRGRLNFIKYINLDIGWSGSNFKDELPFNEALVFTSGQLSGLPSNGKSKISSSGIYYSIGGRIPITKQLQFNANYGQRNFSAERSIPNCSNCNEVDLDLDAGNYIRAGLSWLTFKAANSILGEFDLLYTHHFEGSFQYSVTLGFFVYL